MFMVKGFVEDKALASVLRAFAQAKALEVQAVPVANAVADGRKLRAATNGTSADMAFEQLRSMKRFKARDVQSALRSVGRSAKSSPGVIKSLVKDKRIKRVGRSQYEVAK